jgi:hypothetical protein
MFVTVFTTVLSKMNPFHTPKSYFDKILFNITPPLRLILQSGLFHSGFGTKILYEFFIFHAYYTLRPSHSL